MPILLTQPNVKVKELLVTVHFLSHVGSHKIINMLTVINRHYNMLIN